MDANEIFLKCSCYYGFQYGIPCKHILTVKLFLQQDNLENLQIYERWKKDSQIPNNLGENLIVFLKEKLAMKGKY